MGRQLERLIAMDFIDKLPRPLRTAFILIRDTIQEFGQDKAARIAAALAYYAAFAIAPMLLVVIGVVGLFWGASEADMQARIISEITGMIGEDGASVIATMLENTADTGTGIIATIAGIGGLIWGATRLFAQLQGALNDIWNVAPKPGRGIMKLVMTRLLSFGMVLVVGLLMLAAMVIGAVVAGLRDTLSGIVPGSAILIDLTNILLPLALMTVLFAAIYRYLPDAEVEWRDVWMGAFITAILFSLGRYGIGFYLGNSSTASAYGAAGSFVLLLLWIYFTSMIFLFGAEFTQVWARHHGHRIGPTEHAVRVPTLADFESGEIVAINVDDEDGHPVKTAAAVPAPPTPPTPPSSDPPHTDPPTTGSPLWKRAAPIVAAFLIGRMLTRRD